MTIVLAQAFLMGCSSSEPDTPQPELPAPDSTTGFDSAPPGTSGVDPVTSPSASGGSSIAPSNVAPSGMSSTEVPSSSVSPANAVPPPDEPSAGFIRRLTHVEFDNTVADLLGIENQPSSGFAADVALQGFTNNAAGQNVTPTLTEQYIEVVEDLSRTATQSLTKLLGCDPAAIDEQVCIGQFVGAFGKRAWRRPITSDEQSRALALFQTARAEYELDVSVQMLVQYFLLSPHFLYLVEPLPTAAAAGSVAPLDPWKVASRLSYFLHGSMPDEALFAAAEAGTLDTAEGVAAEARRLLEQPRARQRIGLLFTEWLRLRSIDKLQKDSVLFPDFDLSIAALMREQVERFAQAVILDDGGTAADLLTAPFTFINNKLAPFYGVDAPAGSSWARVDLDPTQRSGLLTHTALLATFAHQNQTDPVTRGKFVRESLLCEGVPAPPVGLVVTAPEITPGSTTRERFAQHQEDPSCRGCHALMDPIGLGFENYDPVGRWRDMDNGAPVDATGQILGSDVAGTFDGAIELSAKLANSKQATACVMKTWLRFALGRSEQAADKGAFAVLNERSEAAGFKLAELLIAMTQTNTFRYQRVLDATVSALEDPSLKPAAEENP